LWEVSVKKIVRVLGSRICLGAPRVPFGASLRSKCLIAALLAVPALDRDAAYADVQVSYTVDEKALKTAVAGTDLTFQLYSDNGCATSVGTPVTVAIENVDLIERLKRFKPTGAPIKPPRTDRLTHRNF